MEERCIIIGVLEINHVFNVTRAKEFRVNWPTETFTVFFSYKTFYKNKILPPYAYIFQYFNLPSDY